MTAKLHRILTGLSLAVAGMGGLMTITEPSTLGIAADTWATVGAWLAFVGGVIGVGVTVLRQMQSQA